MEALVRSGFDLLRGTAAVAAGLLPAETGLAWRELRNKLAAFEGFRRAASGGLSLQGALALPAAERLWALEGVGYALARAGRLPAEMELPVEALLPVHTGAGLALGEEGVGDPGRFADRCRAAARPGCSEALFEALGLVARTLRPEAMDTIDAAVGELGAGPRALFWHGAGRGAYLAPSNALPLPGGSGRGLGALLAEAPGREERRQAAGGFAWALALVNLGDAAVVEHGLSGLPGDDGASIPALAHGVATAAAVWALSNGEDARLRSFVGSLPGPLAAACRRSLREAAARVRRTGAFGGLFRVPEEAR
jgi:hypothetical protein